MTRSSSNKLFTLFKDLEREFRSSRRYFKTLSLDESRSPDFDLFSDQEEYSEEEVAETMAETMEQYMSQFLKELRDNTFNDSGHEDANEHIEKVLEIVDLFHIPNITEDQVMLRVFPMSLTGAARGYRSSSSGFLSTGNNAKCIRNPSYQERRQTMEETLSKFMSESAKRHEENSNMIKEIRASTNAAIRNQGESIKTLEIQIGQMSKEKDPGSFTLPYFINNVCFDNALDDSGASVSVMTLLTYLNLGLDMLEDVKVSLIIERPFLSTAHAKIDVFKRKITLRVGEERVIFKSVKPASSLIKRVYMLSLRERMELDLEGMLMGETLVLNRSLDPLNGDYIELNNLNEPLELRINQVDNSIPTVEEGGVIDAPMDDLVKPRNDKLDT
ncbi:hypothetical protein Tco_0988437 [Tanacetum coccineum]|uniref:Uncharacterized protein n=1 Tax=Tanacetum coccineum TaxID=301880 RepID=A0ABQ5ER01_9ASTR